VQDFFSYDSSNGLVSPCSDETSGMLVCSQLSDLVSTAAEFCKAAGALCTLLQEVQQAPTLVHALHSSVPAAQATTLHSIRTCVMQLPLQPCN
jgi:hypothetical protein